MKRVMFHSRNLLQSTALSGGNAFANNIRATCAIASAAAIVVLLTGPTAAAQDTGMPCSIIGLAGDISSQGANGPDGKNGGDDEPGQDGTQGSPGSDVTTNLQTARQLQSNGLTSPINIDSFGGTGGAGGQGDDGDTGIANNRGAVASPAGPAVI